VNVTRYVTRVKQQFLRWARIALVVCAVLAGPAIRATTVIAPTFETLVGRADLVFTGRMISERSEWRKIDGQRSIVTLVTFEVLSVQKGNAGRTIELQFLGGTVGGATLEVASMPRFTKGERAVLFVEKNGVNASPLVGFYHGRFRLVPDASGQETVAKHDGTPLADVSEIGRAVAAQHFTTRAMTHGEFSAKIAVAARHGK